MLKHAFFTCSALATLLLMGCNQEQMLGGDSSSSGISSSSSSSSSGSPLPLDEIFIASKLLEPGNSAPASAQPGVIGKTEFFVNSGANGEIFRPLWAHIPSDAMVSFELHAPAGSPFIISPQSGVISISPAADMSEFIDQKIEFRIDIRPDQSETRVLASSADFIANVVQADASPDNIKLAVLYPPPGANTAADNDGRVEVVINAQEDIPGAVKAVTVNGASAYKISTDDDIWYAQINLGELENALDIQAVTTGGTAQKSHSLLHDLPGLSDWQTKDLTGLAWNGELWLQAHGLFRWQPLRENSSVLLFEAKSCYEVQGSWGVGFYTYSCFSAVHAQAGVPWLAALSTYSLREDFNGQSSHSLIRYPVTIDSVFQVPEAESSGASSAEPLSEYIFKNNQYQISYTGNKIFGDVRNPISGYQVPYDTAPRLIVKPASVEAAPVDHTIDELNMQYVRAAENIPSMEFEISGDHIYFVQDRIVGVASSETLRILKSFELPADLGLKAQSIALDPDSQAVYLNLTGSEKGGIYAMSMLNGDLVKLAGIGFDQLNQEIPKQSSSGWPFGSSSSSSSSSSASSSSSSGGSL